MSPYSTLEHDSADPNDYLDVAHHEVDRQEELEYEVWMQLPNTTPQQPNIQFITS